MLLVQKSDSRKGILPFSCLCQVFALIFILVKDEAWVSEPEPGAFASLIRQQQQIHDRMRPAQESHLQAEYIHADTWAGFHPGTESGVKAYVCRVI